MTLSRCTALIPVAALLVAAGPAWAGVIEVTSTVTLDAISGSTSFTLPGLYVPGQPLTGVTVALSGSVAASATATNAAKDFSNFVTASFAASYQLTGPGGVFITNVATTSGVSGAVARAGSTLGTLRLEGAGSTAQVIFTVPAAMLSAFQGAANVTFGVASTGLAASTTCVVLKPYNVRTECGLPANSFGPATGSDTVTTKLSYFYGAVTGDVPPIPPLVSGPAPLAMPEPGSKTLLGVGMIGMGLLRRRIS